MHIYELTLPDLPQCTSVTYLYISFVTARSDINAALEHSSLFEPAKQLPGCCRRRQTGAAYQCKRLQSCRSGVNAALEHNSSLCTHNAAPRLRLKALLGQDHACSPQQYHLASVGMLPHQLHAAQHIKLNVHIKTCLFQRVSEASVTHQQVVNLQTPIVMVL